MTDSWEYSKDVVLQGLAKLVFAAAFAVAAGAAVYQYVRGFVEGALESREAYLLAAEQDAPPKETPFPSRMRSPRYKQAEPPAPVPQAVDFPDSAQVTGTVYEVTLDDDNEVLLNGLPIGHIDTAPYQFCSYDEHFGNGPARKTKREAWDDAADYAESLAKLNSRS